MRDVDEGDAHLTLNPEQLELHLLAELEVKCAKRLVEQQYLGLVDNGPGERYALSLAAGELSRLAGPEAGQTDHIQRLAHPLAPLRLGHVPDPQAVFDVLRDRHVREERIVLEHRVDVPGVWGDPCHVAAAELDPPAVRAFEPRDQSQQSGLPRPGRAEQREEFTRLHGEVDARERDHVAVPLLESFDMDRWRHGSPITCGGGLRRTRDSDHSGRCTTVQPGLAMRLRACLRLKPQFSIRAASCAPAAAPVAGLSSTTPISVRPFLTAAKSRQCPASSV